MSLEWLRILGLHWYDRDPESKIDTYSLGLTPHAEAIQLTYLCPVDKKAMVELLTAEVVRTTAAGVAGTPSCKWYLTPDGKDQKILVMAWLSAGENSVGDRDVKTYGGNIMLYAGDKLEGATGDGSTGGKVYHTLVYKITEFNAFPTELPSPDIQEPEVVKDPAM